MQNRRMVESALQKAYEYADDPRFNTQVQSNPDFYGKQLWFDRIDVSEIKKVINVLE
jgi:hypothetical protein